MASYAKITSPVRTANVKEVYPLREIDCNQLQLSNKQEDRKLSAAQSVSIFVENVENCKPDNSRSQKKAKAISSGKTTKFVLDATSPDHCFYVLKPTSQHCSKDNTKLHDTLVLPIVYTEIVGSNRSSFESSPDLGNKSRDCGEAAIAVNSNIQQSNTKGDSKSCFNFNENSLSDSASCSLHSNVKDSFERHNNKLSDNLCTSTAPCEPDDEMCKRMLLASRSAFTTTDKNKSAVHTISYETVPSQESFCSFADSTVPLEHSKMDVECPKQTIESVACDDALTEQFSQLATQHSHTNTRCLPEANKSLNHQSNASMSSSFDGNSKCNESNIFVCKRCDIQNSSASERELKLYLR